jgi:D-alanine-D-alanine ligase-like ATP-grasp enzyme
MILQDPHPKKSGKAGPVGFSRGSSGECLAQALSAREISYRFLSPDEITNPKVAQKLHAAFQLNDTLYYFFNGGLRIADPDGVRIPGPRIDGPIKLLLRRKDLVKAFLRKQSISTPEGASFPKSGLDEAEVFFETFSPTLSEGVCVKPRDGRKGRRVHLRVRDVETFRKAFLDASKAQSGQIIVEEMVTGTVYRFLCLAGRVIAIHYIKPSNVEGDGVNTIADLVRLKNAERRLNPGHCRSSVRLGKTERSFLQASGFNIDDVPPEGAEVFLSNKPDPMIGGEYIDVTDELHPSYIEIIERAVRTLPGLIICGADVIIQNAETLAAKDNYHVLELNTGPSISAHHYPWRGTPRDVAGQIIDHLASNSLSGWVTQSSASRMASLCAD